MERPLENTATAMLWRTLFGVIVELGIRSGTPSIGGARPARGSVPSEDQLQEEHESEPPGGEEAGQVFSPKNNVVASPALSLAGGRLERCSGRIAHQSA